MSNELRRRRQNSPATVNMSRNNNTPPVSIASRLGGACVGGVVGGCGAALAMANVQNEATQMGASSNIYNNNTAAAGIAAGVATGCATGFILGADGCMKHTQAALRSSTNGGRKKTRQKRKKKTRRKRKRKTSKSRKKRKKGRKKRKSRKKKRR